MLAGDSGNDYIYGGKLVDAEVTYNTDDVEIYGGSGNDNIYSGKGNDFIVGGSGNDVITLNGGANVIDFINIGEGERSAQLNFGEDTIYNATSNDVLRFVVNYGDNENPDYLGYKVTDLSFNFTEDDLEITAGEGNKVTIKGYFSSPARVNKVRALNDEGVETEYVMECNYQGSAEDENIIVVYDGHKHIPLGGEEVEMDSVIYGNGGNDIIHGGAKDDWINGSEGNDIIYGGNGGNDMLAGEVGDDYIYAGKLNSDDTVTYNTDDVEIYGGQGNDHIYSGKGDDFIWGGQGTDTITLNGGSNTIVFVEPDFGADTVYNATSNDTLKFSLGGETPSGYKITDLSFNRNNDDLVITAGENTVTIDKYFAEGNSKLTKVIALNKEGTAQENYILATELQGSAESENIVVIYDGNKHQTLGGEEVEMDSVIYGNGGNDTILGGDKDDWINGSEGNDTIYGGNGGKDVLSGDVGKDAIYGGKLNSDGTITYNTEAVEIYGGDGDDSIYSGKGDDFIWGGKGDDEITLNGGNNTIMFAGETSSFMDTIKGSTSDDTLKFTCNGEGYKFSQLAFKQSGEDLLIRIFENDEVFGTVKIKDYYTEGASKIDKIIALDDDGVEQHYSIKTDAKTMEVESVSDYVGTDYHEYIKLIQGDVDEYEGGLEGNKYTSHDGDEITVNSYANGMNGNDTIFGTSGNDWLNGNNDDDTLYGGSGGKDMLIGGEGKNTIYASDKDGNLNSDGVEIYGGGDVDTIYSGLGDDYINAGKGNDIIMLRGGNNTVIVSGEEEGFVETIKGSTSQDTIKFGYKYSQFSFSQSEDMDSLLIEIKDDDSIIGTVKVEGFFSEGASKLDNIIALDDEGNEQTYNIKNVKYINMISVSDFNGNDYHEYIKLMQGDVNENDDVLSGNTYTSNADNKEYTVNAYASTLGGEDKIIGTSGNDWINSGEGNDIIYGGNGGHDMLSGHAGSNTIYASDENGTLNPDGVEIYGGDGTDNIYTGSGNDFIWAKGGNDTITSNGGGNTYVFIEDDFGDDVIIDSSMGDILKFAVNYGTKENPVYVGYTYDEISFVRNDETHDVVITAQHEGGKANTVTIKNYIDGKSAHEILVLANDRSGYDYKDIQHIIPEPYYDDYVIQKSTITGTVLSDEIEGDKTKLAGKSKTIKGIKGNDYIAGGKGNDKIYGGEGKNVYAFRDGDGKDTVYSDGGADTLAFEGFSEDDKFVMSESGTNLVISYGSNGDKVTLKNFLKGRHSVKAMKVYDTYGDEITSFAKDLTKVGEDASVIELDMETLKKKSIKGSAFAETIVGSTKNNTIKGGGGNDIIYANQGTNKIYTQSKAGENATVYTGTGKDTLNAGKGTDTYVFYDGTLNDTVVANTTGTVVLDVSNLSEVSFSEKGNNLIITNKYSSDGGVPITETITVKNYLKNKLTDNVMIIPDDTGVVQNLHEYLSELQSTDISTLVVGDYDSSKKQTVKGSFLDETLAGGYSNDTIKSNGGNDTIFGGMGNDKIYGYIAKVNKVAQYDDAENADNFVFNYTVGDTTIDGSGKDIIYNAKVSDRITMAVIGNGGKSTSDAVQQLLTDMSVLHSNKNLVINYGYGLDNKGNTVVTDSIILSGYDKLTSEQSIRYFDLVDADNNVLATLDLKTDFGISGHYNYNSESVKNYFNSTTYDMSNDGELRKDNTNVYGNDTYNFSGADSAKTIVFDGHGNDTYNTGLNQFVYINDTKGNDMLNLTSTGDVKMFFDVSKDGRATGSMLFVDTDKISGYTPSGSVEVADWFDGKSDDMAITVNGEAYTVSDTQISNIVENVSSWLTTYNYDSAKSAYDAYNQGTATFDEEAMAQLIAYYTE